MAFHASLERPEDLPATEARIRTEIRVRAEPARVWEVLTDLEAYAEWNPFIVEAEVLDGGPVEEGARLRIRTVTGPDDAGTVWKPVVLDAEPARLLRWRGTRPIPGLLAGTHVFELERRGERQTKLVHRERFKGLKVPWMKRAGLAEVRLAFEAMNEALKARAEAGAPV